MSSVLRRLRRWRPSRIGIRLLAFNLLLVFLPLAAILYLDVYETRLLDLQERGMAQQARLVAAALGDGPSPVSHDAAVLLARFSQRGDARIRVYDANGALVADSVRHADPASIDRVLDGASDYPQQESVRQRLLYRLGVWLVRARTVVSSVGRGALLPSTDLGSEPDRDARREIGPGPEIRAALDGRYGTAVRRTPGQRSLTLYVAVPVRQADRIVGAAVVSQSTFRILQALYDVRLRIFQIVVASIAFAVVLGFVMSATIVRPLLRLRHAAVALSERRATPSSFRRVDRRDEIGDLARSLEDLTFRLDAHIRLLESFAGDVSHEFKNPLASIRVAAEAIAASGEEAERDRLLGMLTRDVDRLERLVSGVRELARIDAQLAHEEAEPIELTAFVRDLVQGVEQRETRVRFGYRADADRLHVRASPDRLAQVVENLLENAASFAPPGSVVDVSVARDGSQIVLRVEDRGPGFPDAHLARVFDRFFSYRPGSGTRDHMGLGLSIVRAIVEGYGGQASAVNRPGGGASIELQLPMLTSPQPSSRLPQIEPGARS